jgi:hypothetical protein
MNHLSPDRRTAADLRADYAHRWPAWSQPFITCLSGKAAVNEPAPSWLAGPRTKAIQVVVQLLLVSATVLWLLNTVPLAGLLVLPAAWLLQVNALLKSQVVIAHHAVHGEVCKTKTGNYRIQVLVSALALVKHFEQHFADHVRGHHNRRLFTTERDPDAIFLKKLGLRPGESVDTLRRRTWLAPLSPHFHAVYLTARLRTNFITAPWHRRIVALIYVGLLVGVATVVPWWAFMLAILVPLIPLYQVASFVLLLSEHAWTLTSDSATSKQAYANRCWGRFFLEPLPAADEKGAARIASWVHWTLRTALVQLPCRIGVVIGDTPGHDHHHLYPADHDWTKTLWTRQTRIDSGKDPQGMGTREFTCLRDALTFVLHHIASTGETATNDLPDAA